MLYRVVCKDNYDSETRSEFWVSEPMSKEAAQALANQKNERAGEHSSDYFQAVQEDYKLYKFEP